MIMELCVEIMRGNMAELVCTAFGYGSIMAIIPIMTGYVISKVQGLVNDK